MVKKTKRENFFGIPFLPLAIFLLLIIVLFILPPAGLKTSSLTGKVTSNIDLIKTEYNPNENLEGEVDIKFFWGDFIPATTNVEFIILGEGYNSDLIVQLPQAIALSSTPWKGNFTYGEFNNMHGPSPTGFGYGFGACSQLIPVPNVTYPVTYAISGYAMQQQQPVPLTPDLTVVDIYTSGVIPPVPAYPAITTMAMQSQSPVQSTERLYTKIKNLGGPVGSSEVRAGTFTVVGCWYDYNSPTPTPLGAYIPSNCFFIKPISQIGYNQEIILDMGNWNVEGKTVQVIVDFYNEVFESNELNNEMIKSFGGTPPPQCIDPDGLDYFTKGTCTDANGGNTDYCSPDAENLLIEYHCPFVTPSPLCMPTQYICPNGCENGACIEQGPSPTCKDTDGGKNYGLKGTCIDVDGSYVDYCLEAGGEENLAEYYCTGNDLIVWDSECSDCSEPYCAYIGSRGEGWYAKCPKGEKLIKYECYVKGDKFKPVCMYEGSKSEGWYTPDVCERESFDCYYGCLDGSCKISNYSCKNWNNIYKINISNLNIKAPEERGTYDFIVALTYEGLTLYSYNVSFNVTSHRACQNQQCVYLPGAGNDQCQTNSDCQTAGGGGGGGGGGGSCNENWQYGPWSECIDDKKQRECYDVRNCGTTFAKPSYCLPLGDEYYQTESCIPGCQENWHCTEWSYCDEQTLEQSAICEDLNKCNPQNFTYMQLRGCCIEEWDCEWSSCIGGVQEKICEDVNYCGTEFTKPAPETRDCAGFPWWAYVVIVLVLVIVILTILYATKAWPFKKRPIEGMAEEEKAEFKEIEI